MGAAAAAGFTYDGERFERNFADFEQKYGFHDMYTGGFYPFPTKEEMCIRDSVDAGQPVQDNGQDHK